MLDPASEIPSVSSSHDLLVPPPKQKRSSVACRRCRRLRAKCVKDEDKGLCRGCIEAGVPNECQFLPRGMSAIDRAVSACLALGRRLLTVSDESHDPRRIASGSPGQKI